MPALGRIGALPGGQFEHAGDVAEVFDGRPFEPVGGRGDGRQVHMLAHERRQLRSHAFDHLRAPMRVVGKVLEPARLEFGGDEGIGAVEDEDAGLPEVAEEGGVGGVLDGLAAGGVARGELFGMDDGFDGRGHDDQADAAGRQLAVEVEDSAARVGLGRGLPFAAAGGAAGHLAGLQEARAGDVINAGAVEEPAAAAAVGLLVARAEPGGEEELGGRAKGVAEDGLVLEGVLVGVDFAEEDGVGGVELVGEASLFLTCCVPGARRSVEHVISLRQGRVAPAGQIGADLGEVLKRGDGSDEGDEGHDEKPAGRAADVGPADLLLRHVLALVSVFSVRHRGAPRR